MAQQAQQQTPPRMVRGTVEQTNDRGIQVGGQWFNYSQFQEVPHPEPGDAVTMEVVRDRFIRALKLGGAAPEGPAAPRRVGPLPAGEPAPAGGPAQLRATAALAACTLLAGREGVTTEDALDTAGVLFAWIAGKEG